MGISDLEGKGSAKGNDGFFDKGLMTALESNHRAGGVYQEVKVVANGHCHSTPSFMHRDFRRLNRDRFAVTENCRRVKGIWMCFGGGGCVQFHIVLEVQYLDAFTPGLTPAMERSASIAGSGSSTSQITARPSELTNERKTTRS